MRWQGKKGFYWEVTPERRSSVEREVERYLRQEGKLRDMDQIDGTRGSKFDSCCSQIAFGCANLRGCIIFSIVIFIVPQCVLHIIKN